MKCPVCSHALREFTAGKFKVDICADGCSGIWFDAKEFENCDQHDEAFPKELLRVKKNADVVIDRNKKRACPRCDGSTLSRVVLDPEKNFEIDHCPKCLGHWLDIGELEKIRDLDKENREIDARLNSFEKRAQEELKDPAKAKKIRGFLQLIFR